MHNRITAYSFHTKSNIVWPKPLTDKKLQFVTNKTCTASAKLRIQGFIIDVQYCTLPKPQTIAIKQVIHLSIDMRTAQNQFALQQKNHSTVHESKQSER